RENESGNQDRVVRTLCDSSSCTCGGFSRSSPLAENWINDKSSVSLLSIVGFLKPEVKDSRSSHKRGKAMDQTKWQALKNRSRPSKNSGKDVTFPTDPKELYRTLKALNSLTAEPMTFLKDDTMSGNSLFSRPRAYQSRTVDPSEQKSEADEDVFKKFSELTDIHGIYHRARSRSPFTKP
ncbi:hypothetical protein OSTOST_23329, partial [Ostertagia ostertagi]